MLAKQFIQQLESQGLLAPDIVEELSRQVAESKSRLTPEIIAKLLVDNGHLTKFQATKIIADLKSSASPAEAAGQSSRQPSREPVRETPKKPTWQDEEELLGFAPDDDEQQKKESSKPAKAGTPAKRVEPVAAVFLDDEVVEIPDNEVADVQVSEEVEQVVSAKAEVQDRPRPVAQPVQLDEFSSTPMQVVRTKMPKANPLDSFRIIGVGTILAVVVIVGIWLGWYFIRGNAADVLKRADDSYEQRSYETAAAIYKDFVTRFSSDPKVSFAKVRQVLANIRKDVENAPDPSVGLKTALELLPPMASESALAAEQGDLTGVLLNLAGKLNERADNQKETTQKKGLMSDMDKLMELINNPQFVGTTQRNQQKPTLDRIQEDRQRILRDINRDEELAKSLTVIAERLDAKQTVEAFQVRKTLIDQYPQLESDPGLKELVKRATSIQQSLVASASPNFKLSADPITAQPATSKIFANRTGKESPAFKGRTIFVRAKGSIYGLDGLNGNVLWRHYVGSDLDHDPLRLQDTGSSDLLVAKTQSGQLARLDGSTGKTKWKLDVGSRALPPALDGTDAIISLRDGTLAKIDVEAGQTKWATKLPQNLETVPSVNSARPLYLPGDHGNIYVLDSQNGTCLEVYYLGHRTGSIAVPPILSLGQLFVFENAGQDYSIVHILKVGTDGLGIETSQPAKRLKGNIVVPPQIYSRRLVVMTDLSEIRVFDIEPTNEREKVSEIGAVQASESSPRPTWGFADNNELWTTGLRLSRYTISVATGQLKLESSEFAGDQFLGPPQVQGDAMILARTVRGTQGVRVAAITAQTGATLWQTDLAVPIAVVSESGVGNSFDAVTANGAMFSIGREPIVNKALEDPEAGKAATLYSHAETLDGAARVMLNDSARGRFAYYRKGAAKRLSTMTVPFSGANATCPPTAVGANFAIGLSNGQLILIDPANGANAASPFQLPMEPGKQVKWNQPAYLPDAQVLVAYSDQQRLLRLGVAKSIKLLSDAVLDVPLRGPLAAIENKVVAVADTKSADTLQVFDSNTLKIVASQRLDGRVIQGPYSVAGLILLHLEDSLQAFDSSCKSVWSIKFPETPIVGKPTVFGSGILLASAAGKVWSLDPKTGNTLGYADVANSLSAPPLALEKYMLYGTKEGCVLLMPPLGPAPGSGK